MVLLHDSKLESPLQLEFLLAEPRPSLRLRASRLKNPSLHPVLSPTLCFCGSSVFFKTFFFFCVCFSFARDYQKALKLPWPSLLLLSPLTKGRKRKERLSVWKMSPNVNVSLCWPQRQTESQTTQPWVMSFLERVQQRGFFVFVFFFLVKRGRLNLC